MPLKQIFHNIGNLGITDSTPFELKNKLRVFNNAVLIIFFISLFYAVIGIVHSYHIAVCVTMYSVGSNILSLLLVKKGKYNIAFHYTMWYGYLFLSAFSYLFGGANNSYYFFLFMPVVCNIFFDNKIINIVYLVLCALFMLANVYFVDHYKPHYGVEEWMKYFSYPNIVFVILLIYVGVRLFKLENVNYANKIEEQRKVLEEKNQEITDSINYARKIQLALIPGKEELSKYFKDSFVLFKPKDIVSGDFYWVTKKNNYVFYATSDCTGHGVPGGFMTMLGLSFLEEIVDDRGIYEPADILDNLRDKIVHTLKQTGTAGENKDGMDIVICRIDSVSLELTYSAANNSLYLVKKGTITEFKPDKQPCGFYHEQKAFSQTRIQLEAGDRIYTFTDGFADQFGGPKGKKFKYKQLEELTVSIQNLNLNEQCSKLEQAFDKWKGNLEQIDDVCMIGVEV